MTHLDIPACPPDLTIAEAATLMRTRRLSPLELIDALLARIDRIDGDLHSFITVTAEQARRSARAAEQRFAEGEFRGGMDGIPYALKDVFDTAGIRTTCHSRILIENIPTRSAHAVDLLNTAGGVLIGKTATFEFAHGGPSWDLPWPPAVNPWSSRHLPGGSSSGSAAAVAARLVPLALGTDTGGSVRWPAAVCGIVGLKPTYGLVSRTGVFPNSFSMDHCGVMARSAEDCAIALQCIAGHDPEDPTSARHPLPNYRASLSQPLRGTRIGLVRHWYAGNVEPYLAETIDRAVAHLEHLGVLVEEIRLPSLQEFEDCKSLIAMSEVHSVHAWRLEHRPHEFGQSMRSRLMRGDFLSSRDYLRGLQWRRELASRMFRCFRKYDALATAGWLRTAEPNLPGDPLSGAGSAPLIATPFNVTGAPAIVVPCGVSPDGLPISLQIAGKPFDEALVLRIAHAYQLSTDWHRRKPADPLDGSAGRSRPEPVSSGPHSETLFQEEREKALQIISALRSRMRSYDDRFSEPAHVFDPLRLLGGNPS